MFVLGATSAFGCPAQMSKAYPNQHQTKSQLCRRQELFHVAAAGDLYRSWGGCLLNCLHTHVKSQHTGKYTHWQVHPHSRWPHDCLSTLLPCVNPQGKDVMLGLRTNFWGNEFSVSPKTSVRAYCATKLSMQLHALFINASALQVSGHIPLLVLLKEIVRSASGSLFVP